MSCALVLTEHPWLPLPGDSSCPITSFPPPREADELAGLGMGPRLQQGLEKQATLPFVKECKYVSPYIIFTYKL